MTKPRFFAKPDGFRIWLENHHLTAPELLVGLWKRGCGKPGMTWPESVDQALCFGWIDGVRKRIDDESYSIRFTPRRPRGIWSAINITRVAELTQQGLMYPAGLEAFARRSEDKSRIYSYEQRLAAKLEPEHLQVMQQHPDAWAFFEAQPAGYRHQMVYRIVSAKQEATRWRRLRLLLEACIAGKRL